MWFVLLSLVLLARCTGRPTCWISSLCGDNTRVSFTYPAANKTEIHVQFFRVLPAEREEDVEVRVAHDNAFLRSLCFQLELKRAYSAGSAEAVQRHTPLHCLRDIATEGEALLLVALPYALPAGQYEMSLQSTRETERGTERETQRLSYSLLSRREPLLSLSRLAALTPAYGTLIRDHFHLSLHNNLRSLPAAQAHEVLAFNVRGLHQYLLPAHAQEATSRGGPRIEAGSWFFQITPVRFPGEHSAAEAEAAAQTLSLAPPDLYVSPLDGAQVGPTQPVSPQGEALFLTGTPAEGYVEVVLSDQELADQRLFVRSSQTHSTRAQRAGGFREEVQRQIVSWESEMQSLFERRKRKATASSSHSERNTQRENEIEVNSNSNTQKINPIRSLFSKKNDNLPSQTQTQTRTQTQTGTNKEQKKINVCIFGSAKMDGQKRIWLEQTQSLPRDKFLFTWLMPSPGGTDNRAHSDASQPLTNAQSVDYHLQRMTHAKRANNTSNGFALSLERLQELPADGLVTAAMVWEYNTTKLFQYIHQRYERVGGDLSRISPPFCNEFYQTFVQMYRENACDIVVYGNARGYTTDVFIIDAARYLGIPTVTELLNLYLQPDILPDVIVAPSHHSLSHESIQGPIRERERRDSFVPVGVVIPPAMDPAHFNPEPYRLLPPVLPAKNCEMIGEDNEIRTKIDERTFVSGFYKHAPCVLIGFVARLSGEKNPGLLLQAAHDVLRHHPFARFRFIGEGAIKTDLMMLAQRLGVEHAVEFTGWVSTDDLPRHLADIDILVNPSLRGWSETFCISNIEAMSMELPLVTFAVGGIGEYIFAPNSSSSSNPQWRLSENALIIDSANPLALSDGIRYFIDHPDVARETGRRGRQSLLQYFTIERQMLQYEKLYESLYRNSRS